VPEIELDETDTISMRLRMRPPWSFIDQLRRFTEAFCASSALGEVRSGQVALAVHELTQNAVSHGGGAPIELVLEVSPPAGTIRIALSNRCSPAAFAALAARVEHLRGTEPLAAYVGLMRSAPPEAPGGLGLPRVRYEGALELEASFDAQCVTVTAFGGIDPHSAV
jgi:anti-sigma regulatory factor (Ser/Thr protein kinase)